MPALTRLLLLLLLATVGLAHPSTASAQATGSFEITDIRVEGLQRISAGTVFNYLPLKVGDTVDDNDTADAIRALFQTGFFRDVRIERDGSTLVVSVVERPSIASITLEGNDSLSTDALMDQLRQIGFSVGRVFNRSIFEQVEQELRRAYFAQGKYAVRITSAVTPLERNRVGIDFNISEGRVAKIKEINIVGNQLFEEDDLVDLFELTTPGLWTWASKSDQYSKQKLAADLETLRSFYLDRGYANFSIDSTQVSITPDKRFVYITINVTEGEQFRVSDIKLAGDLVVDEQELFPLVQVRRGDVFSRKAVTETTTGIGDRLGKEGYAFANVNAVPDLDDEGKQVSLTFFIDPGKLTYVRRINFQGNTKTRDEVLRREMRQIESAPIDTAAIARSKERLERLGYFEEVNVETPAVPGTTDQVDVLYNVVERPSGNLVLGAGFSQSDGVVVQSSISQENFLGTGNRLSATFNSSDSNTRYAVSWLDPYWTIDGVSRGFDAYYREINARDANLADYDLAELGLGVTFGIPLNEFDRLNLGLLAENTKFKTLANASNEVLAFERANGDEFITLVVTGRWAHDTRNRFVFPDEGGLTEVATEISVPGGDLTYYKISFGHQQFFQIVEDYTLLLQGEVGYGDGYGSTSDLPLIDNFYSGGIRSVRGFEGNTLGPRDSRGEPLGGDTKVEGRAELILPVPFAPDSRSLRLTGFVDGGNVFGPGQDFEISELRYSVGLGAVWLSPLGAVTVSIAQPLNDEPGDDTQPFQFTFGTSF